MDKIHMENDEETYAPNTSPMYSTIDCHLFDQLNLLKPCSPDSPKAFDEHSEIPTKGNVIFDMFGMVQFPCALTTVSKDRCTLKDAAPFTDNYVSQKPVTNFPQSMLAENSAAREHQLDHGEFDPICFLKLPVLAEKDVNVNQKNTGHHYQQRKQHEEHVAESESRNKQYNTSIPCVDFCLSMREECSKEEGTSQIPEQQNPILSNNTYSETLHAGVLSNCSSGMRLPTVRAKRKRSRTFKNSEEVESQRMTHIAVERNRRKQMNEHLRILRSLMPGSYVQRGDQASIIGGAIEFVKELEQLLHCLESQKCRRLYSEGSRITSASFQPSPSSQIAYPPQQKEQLKYVDPPQFLESFREDVAEVKSPVADIEVKLVGYDAMIKILSQRKPGQLLQTIAALENLQFSILHTNITTIEHTVLYSFTIKIKAERNTTAEEIATSVQQIMIQAATIG